MIISKVVLYVMTSSLTFNYNVLLNPVEAIPAEEIRRLSRWSCIGTQAAFASIQQLKWNDGYEVQFEHDKLTTIPLSTVISEWFKKYERPFGHWV